jgi:hypothetical protein
MASKNAKKKENTSNPEINLKPKLFLSLDLFFRNFHGRNT